MEDAELVQAPWNLSCTPLSCMNPPTMNGLVSSASEISADESLAADLRPVHPYRIRVAAAGHDDVVPLVEIEGCMEARFRDVPAEEPLRIAARVRLEIQIPAMVIDHQADIAPLIVPGEAAHEEELGVLGPLRD